MTEFCDKMNLRIVRELSLCTNHLTCIPNNFSQHLSHLQRLDISNNNLKELPSSFNLLMKLEHLKLDHNEFQTLPKVLAEIRSLKTLSISHNKLEEHSEDLGSLINLESLDLSSNNLSSLPYSFVRLNRLRELNLAENKFNIIPECIINGMRNLEFLDLSLNKKIKLNVPPCSRILRKFDAMNNGVCRRFPRWLLTSKFSALQEVNLNGTEFTKFKFPDENSLLNLRSLSMTQSTVSDQILEKLTRNMIRLEKLNVGNENPEKEGNILCNLPVQQLKNPHLLREIYIPGVGLPMMGRSVADLRNITIMDIGRNRIGWLPDEFCLLQKLEILIMDNNGLSILPDNFGNLVALKELIANSNRLSNLPDSMGSLKKLCFLDLYENDFTEMPVDLDNLENLEGLDMEYNFFSTESLMVRGISYEVMRKSIQERYESYSQRTVGTKVRPEENDYANSVCSTSSLKSEFYREIDKDSPDAIYLADDSNLEENWELSEDSTEDYEPNCITAQKYRYTTSMVPTKFSEHFFCPADLHVMPIQEQVLYMRDDAISMPNFEEGQFDDA
ncbi:leucine-rich repeat protein soc-2 homolog isoform X2 [Belonocnema kinseyi]|nr:leucine-rich repeat protein soc-2 homolog isoform X2 [Belonocnema kinseyi]